MVILFLMYAVNLVAEYFEMVPQDIIYIRCRGQSLSADFFQDFKDFPFRRGILLENVVGEYRNVSAQMDVAELASGFSLCARPVPATTKP